MTVAAVIEREGRFLLVEERTADGLQLNNPAGHLDPGESPAEGCTREVLEETAHPFTPEALVGIYLSRSVRERATGPTDTTYVRFAFCGRVGQAIDGWVLDHGIVRAVWLTPDEIRASRDRHRSPLVVQCMEDYLGGQRYPLELVQTDASVWAPRASL